MCTVSSIKISSADSAHIVSCGSGEMMMADSNFKQTNIRHHYYYRSNLHIIL